MAGVKDPTDDLDLVELHDAFTISDIQTYEDIGIRPYGQGREYVESGDCYLVNPKTGKQGKLPANLSGGLIGCMHAVGATGIMQVVELRAAPLEPPCGNPRQPQAAGSRSASRSPRTGWMSRCRTPTAGWPSATPA